MHSALPSSQYLVHSLLLLLWNCKSITSLQWITNTMYHVLGIELHMKQKFTECLTKSPSLLQNWKTPSGDSEKVTRSQNKSHGVIDMDRNVSCEQYFSTLERQKRESVWNCEKCFILKVGRRSTRLSLFGCSLSHVSPLSMYPLVCCRIRARRIFFVDDGVNMD
jgi:hypothetical protein